MGQAKYCILPGRFQNTRASPCPRKLNQDGQVYGRECDSGHNKEEAMDRHLLSVCVITAFGFALLPGASVAQQKSMKDQLVGTWTLLLNDNVKPDGSHEPLFGPNPSGTVIF